MSGMLSEFVNNEMKSIIKSEYPYIQFPPAVYAKVISVEARGGGLYMYSLKMLDKNMGDDDSFPPFPCTRSRVLLEKGDVAVVVLLYGGSVAWILGRYEKW